MKKVVAYFGMCLSVSTALFSMSKTEELVSIEYHHGEDPLADLPTLVKNKDHRLAQLALRERLFTEEQLRQALECSRNNENCCNDKISLMSNNLMRQPALTPQAGFACILLLNTIASDLTWQDMSNRIQAKIDLELRKQLPKSNL